MWKDDKYILSIPLPLEAAMHGANQDIICAQAMEDSLRRVFRKRQRLAAKDVPASGILRYTAGLGRLRGELVLYWIGNHMTRKNQGKGP